MRPLMRAGAVLAAALLVGGCKVTPPPEPPPPSYAELMLRVTALENEKGEDAYTDPRMDAVLMALNAIKKNGGETEEVARLKKKILAKRRLAEDAMDGRHPESETDRPKGAQVGPMKMEGPAPEAVPATAVKIGAPRDQLIGTYGSCLTRQTWIRGEHGGPTTELFHVSPECRQKLGQKIFVVANNKVTNVKDGNLDGIGTNNPHKLPTEREVVEDSQKKPELR